MSPAAGDAGSALVPLVALDTLWFQVAGTLCDLACTHCLVSSSPSNRTHAMLDLATFRAALAEARAVGVREYYFTGGEPFLHPRLETMLEETLLQGPATVLTNGLRIDAARAARLAALAARSRYSLDLRVSLDGWDAASNDAIRGPGTFARVVAGIGALAAAGMNPVLTVTEVRPENATAAGRARFFALLSELGVDRPRLKVLPLFAIGARAGSGESDSVFRPLRATDAPGGSFEHLQCASCRVVTEEGVWVCPILVNEPAAKMGERLADTLRPFPLAHRACWTCHLSGVSCRT